MCEHLPIKPIESKIITIRGLQVIIDRDLAELYGVETKALNQAVKRNIDRFPSHYRFQLSKEETDEVVTNCYHLSVLKFSPTRAFAFTERGVAMISSILHSPEAIKISIRIMDAFVAMRHFMLENAQVFQRLERIEFKQFETDQKLEQVFAKLAENTIKPQQGIFFDGQVYDAYELVCNLIKDANNKIILIDNYIDDTVLTMLDKRKEWVEAVIYTQQVSNQFKLDLAKHDKQYPAIEVYLFKKAHDRFLIIDETVYLIGASIKDLGKKWFGITAMTATHPNELIARLNDGATSI